MRADGYERSGRAGDLAAAADPIRLTSLRAVAVRVVRPDGTRVGEFEVEALRRDIGRFEPWSWCGTCASRSRPGPVPARDGTATVQVPRGKHGAVKVQAGDVETDQRLAPDATEVTVILRPQVWVCQRWETDPPPWDPALFLRVVDAPDRDAVGWVLNAYKFEEPLVAGFALPRLDPGRYTFELGVALGDGTEVIRCRRTLDVQPPAPGAEVSWVELSLTW